MATKNNNRNIRISDQMLLLIEQQPGNNFTEKWENLVIRCNWELPEKQKELERIQGQIQRERLRLQDMEKLYLKLAAVYNDLNRKMLAIQSSVTLAIRDLNAEM